MAERLGYLISDFQDPVLVTTIEKTLQACGGRFLNRPFPKMPFPNRNARSQADFMIADLSGVNRDNMLMMGLLVGRRMPSLVFTDQPPLGLEVAETVFDFINGEYVPSRDPEMIKLMIPTFMDKLESLMLESRIFGIEAPKVIKIRDLSIDRLSYEVSNNGENVPLTPTEYKLLVFFATNLNRTLSHDQLRLRIWGSGYNDDVVRVTVQRLRDKIGKDHIQTIKGEGYRMNLRDDSQNPGTHSQYPPPGEPIAGGLRLADELADVGGVDDHAPEAPI